MGHWDSFSEEERRRLHFNATTSSIGLSSKQPLDDALKFGPELYRVATVLVRVHKQKSAFPSMLVASLRTAVCVLQNHF